MLQQQHLKKCSMEYFPLLTLHYKLNKRNIIIMFMQKNDLEKKNAMYALKISLFLSLYKWLTGWKMK